MVDCSTVEVEQFQNLLIYFKRLTDDGVTPLIERQVLAMLDSAIDFTCFLSHRAVFPVLERLTINKRVVGSNKRIHDIRQLKYPPSEKVLSYGRCNMKGQSVLYSTLGMLSLYSELRPLRGDLVTVSKWRAKAECTLTYIPIFQNQPNDGTINPRMLDYNEPYAMELRQFPPNQRRKIEMLNQFVADAFTKRFRRVNDLDYIFSAYFANRIFNKDPKDQVEAIYYPSVQQSLAFENLAIKPEVFDAKYELIEVHESIVDMDHTMRQGGTMTIGIAESDGFDLASNKVIWKPTRLTDEEINFYKDQFGYQT